MSAPRCFPGRVLSGRYRLDAIIGRGAVATVWRGCDLRSERACAIKILNAESAGSSHERRRLAREGALVSRLCHPNLALIYALAEDSDGTPFLVMELLVGRTLRDVLHLRGRLTFEQASHLLRQIGSALACAHTMGVLHRDLKPQNIVLELPQVAGDQAFDVERAVVKVVDFGLASERDEPGTASICAPLARDIEYRAPELQEEGAQVEARSDQWSLAVIAYELLAGVQPFRDTDPVHLALQIRDGRFTPLSLHRPDLPAYVGAAIDRALSVRAHDRFASVSDFVRALHGDWPRMFRIATPVATEQEPAPPVELLAPAMESGRSSRLRRPLRAAAGLMLAGLAVLMPLSWLGGVSGRPSSRRSADADLYASQVSASAVQPSAPSHARLPHPIPPLRTADPLPRGELPPLRLSDED